MSFNWDPTLWPCLCQAFSSLPSCVSLTKGCEAKRRTFWISWGNGIGTLGTSTLTTNTQSLDLGSHQSTEFPLGGKAGSFMILKQIHSTYVKRANVFVEKVSFIVHDKVMLPSVIGSFLHVSPKSVSVNKWNGRRRSKADSWVAFGLVPPHSAGPSPVVMKDMSRFLPQGNACSGEKLSYGLNLMTFP